MAAREREDRASGLQKNNGSPVGYGQPKRSVSPSVIMNDEAEGVYGHSPVEEQRERYQPAAYGQPNVVGQGQGLLPWADNRMSQGGRYGDTPVLPGQSYQTDTDPRAQAMRQAAANGYTDVEGVGKGLSTGNYMHQLEGFNTNGWGTGERGSTTLKNLFGQIASRYDVTKPGALNALLQDPELRAYAPDAHIVQGSRNQDQIDFGLGGDPVDVIRSAMSDGSGAAWWWGTDAGGPSGSVGGPASQLYNLPFDITQMPTGLEGQGGEAPEVVDASTANQLLQYLMSIYGGSNTGVV